MHHVKETLKRKACLKHPSIEKRQRDNSGADDEKSEPKLSHTEARRSGQTKETADGLDHPCYLAVPASFEDDLAGSAERAAVAPALG